MPLEPPKEQLPLIGTGTMTAPHEHMARIIKKHRKALELATGYTEGRLYSFCRPPRSEDPEHNTGRDPFYRDFLRIGIELEALDPADAEIWMRYPLDYLHAVAEYRRPGNNWNANEAGKKLIALGAKAGVALIEGARDVREKLTELREAAERALIKIHAGKD
jgi:hypothetical protein